MLGFHADAVKSPSGGYKTMQRDSTSVIEIRQGFYSLYVYTIVTESRVVGDSVVLLLRIVLLEGKQGDVVSKSFDNIQYIPVLHKEFTTIEIDIRHDAGRRVPFERGRVTVTLFFRRRKLSFFETRVTVATIATVAIALTKTFMSDKWLKDCPCLWELECSEVTGWVVCSVDLFEALCHLH